MNIKSMKESIDFLRKANIKDMSNKRLEEHICSFGLNDVNLNEQPISLSEYYGKGLKIWQYPNQLAPFIKYICELKVSSYLEIGCHHGGNFVVISELLKRKNPAIRLIACDIIEEQEVLKEYRTYSEFEYLNCSSGSEEFINIIGDKIEMVMIDGDHFYNGCLRDLMLFIDNENTKHIIMHDIYSSSSVDTEFIWKTKARVDPRFNAIEFVQQYPSREIPSRSYHLGIGLISRM